MDYEHKNIYSTKNTGDPYKSAFAPCIGNVGKYVNINNFVQVMGTYDSKGELNPFGVIINEGHDIQLNNAAGTVKPMNYIGTDKDYLENMGYVVVSPAKVDDPRDEFKQMIVDPSAIQCNPNAVEQIGDFIIGGRCLVGADAEKESLSFVGLDEKNVDEKTIEHLKKEMQALGFNISKEERDDGRFDISVVASESGRPLVAKRTLNIEDYEEKNEDIEPEEKEEYVAKRTLGVEDYEKEYDEAEPEKRQTLIGRIKNAFTKDKDVEEPKVYSTKDIHTFDGYDPKTGKFNRDDDDGRQ